MRLMKEKILNIPNALTILRMLLIPVYWLLFAREQRAWALAVFIFASLTDLLDGWIARKYNQITNFGKLMDPLADKLMVLSVMLSLALRDARLIAPLIIVLCKELLMVLGGLVMLKKGIVVYSALIGKVAQFVFVVSLGLCLLYTESWAAPYHLWLLWISVGLTLCALVYYLKSALAKLHGEAPKDETHKEDC